MTILSALPANYSGFIHQDTPYLPSKFPGRVDYRRYVSLSPTMVCRMKIKRNYANHIPVKFFTSAARNDQYLSSNDGLPQEPFLLALIKEVIWGLRSLFVFLAEQPSQLKYIEWPSFSNTLRTAILTLVLVALLIVALSSVDSALCYVLALLLRKSP
ncbi:hypothetical protein TanjilG_13158 [Lupinus angustifolius]|uniref:uncharacterized protein LOC109335179 n=1 Tax=Lupinus angustifolius TaxID=3871 RepID=UPI00090E5796|nr:PREDICTED: uncharacterized protein LOC109335179 [Lupinus angustifolius]XP_019426830.1 PREDICTED: uncharacterized protein LOC109335179 [Lupinus angustifolius]OIV90303.1 hypothetical protein TanjilG_13158 [Lupinus angustifolius]